MGYSETWLRRNLTGDNPSEKEFHLRKTDIESERKISEQKQKRDRKYVETYR